MPRLKLVLIGGTWSWDGFATAGQWYQAGSPAIADLERRGYDVLSKDHPLIWRTGLDGLVGSNDTWAAAGYTVSIYCDPVLDGPCSKALVPSEDIILWMHSHAWQAGLYACAPTPLGAGLRIRGAVTFGSPIRDDMAPIAEAAFKSGNIPWWVHIRSDWTDKWQVLGEALDGHFGWERNAIYRRDGKVVAKGYTLHFPGVGHSELVNNPAAHPKETAIIDSTVRAFAQGRGIAA